MERVAMTDSKPAGPGRTIHVDSGALADRHLTGIGRYTVRLALALAAREPVRFFFRDEEILPPADLGWSQDQDPAVWAKRLWAGGRRPLARPGPGSVGVFSCLKPIERTFAYEVCILHDLTPALLPHTHARQTVEFFNGFFSLALPHADLALAVSRSTKADAAWMTDIDPARVVVAPSGPSLCVDRHLHASTVRRRGDVALVVSTLEPRKNAFFLLDWFRQSAALPEAMELWWVGPLGWLTSQEQLKPYTEAAGGRVVRLLGVVSDEQLCRLYREAGVSIYPSLYEGFGFPVLDSLRHGTPVLASGNSSIVEFDGPGLHFFDPCDPATLDLAWREHEAAGPVEIPRGPLDRRFSWDNVARILLDAHAEATARDAAGQAA